MDFHAKEQSSRTQLEDISRRIVEMREILGYTEEDMARLTEVSLEDYIAYEHCEKDLPFTFIHKCALVFNIELTELLEGSNARLTSYTVTREGEGHQTAKEEGIDIRNLAPAFKNKLSEPYFVRYEYSEALQHQPIHLTRHSGQEFDYVIEGTMIVQVGSNKEILYAGDSIYYNSSTPHGMIATGGEDCVFLAVVLPEEETQESVIRQTVAAARPSTHLLVEKFVETEEDSQGILTDIRFKNTESFNFGFDVVDAIAEKYPDKLAMIHLDKNKKERRFTFQEIKKESNRCANYFSTLGIGPGDMVMLVLKRHWEFWPAMIGLHKLGAIAVPATYQPKEHDFVYRFNSA
ncbi:MAG: AMP-binding protein [Lachnospiraceae bacterium]|nr:AMP-binding protein [Lachnospiraceae bacterium]